MAQRFGSARAVDASSGDLERDLGWCAPTCMHDNGTPVDTRTQPEPHELSVTLKWRGCTRFVRRPCTLPFEWSMGDAYRGHIEDRAEVESQSGTTRMISTACVHDHDLRPLSQAAYRRLQYGPLTQREEPRHIGVAGAALEERVLRAPAAFHPDRGRPRRLAAFARSRVATREADEAAARIKSAPAGTPFHDLPRGQARLLVLELEWGPGPHPLT